MASVSENDLIAIEREYCERSLSNFIRRAWTSVEPTAPYIHGWHIDAMAEHLEAVSSGEINRLFIAVPPGMMKSLMVGVFFPAWEWAIQGKTSNRFIGAASALHLSVRDNMRARRLIRSDWYHKLWGHRVVIQSDQDEKIKYENTATGFRQAMAFTSMTGSRGDRVLLDDVMTVDDAASDVKRASIIETFLEALPTRLNNPEKSAIINTQQRLHLDDTIGVSVSRDLGYEGLVLPMEFDPSRRCVTKIGFSDPRTEVDELLFPDRFPRDVVERDKRVLGKFATACQFQQDPIPRDGGIFRRSYFEIVDKKPDCVMWVRGWDLAATAGTGKGNGPAYTAGVLMGVDANGVYYVADVRRAQLSSHGVEELIKGRAERDGVATIIDLPQDPGQAGKAQIAYYVKQLAGYSVVYSTESGDKAVRASPVASQAEIGNVKLVKGLWNEAFISESEVFPFGRYKDQIDAMSRAFARLTVNKVDSTPISGPRVV